MKNLFTCQFYKFWNLL